MTDDLGKMCKRLSKHAHAQLSSADLERIANRIEELETKLAKAVEALTNIDALDPEGLVHGCSQWALAGLVLRMGEIARDTLEELKGEN